jgi:hypothetical protein
MSLIVVLCAADIMEYPVLQDTGFMFDEAVVLGELIQETPIHSTGVGGMARPFYHCFHSTKFGLKKMCP